MNASTRSTCFLALRWCCVQKLSVGDVFPLEDFLRAAHVDGEVSADIDRRTDVACDVLHLAKGNEQISGHPLL